MTIKKVLITRKHRMYSKSILILLCPLLLACGGKKTTDSANAETQNGLVTFHLNAPPSKVEPLLLSELADSVSYVALETTKETLTDMAIQCGDWYYAISSGERLLCFDKDGKFLHQIGKKGQGPEEYPWMDDYDYFKVDPVTKWVYVESNNCTQVYDENGKYVKNLTGEMWSFTPYFVYNNLAYFAPYFSPFEIINGSDNQIVRNNIGMRKEKNKFWKELYAKSTKEGKKEFLGDGSAPASCFSKDVLYYWSVYYDTVMMAKGKEVKPLCLIIPENKYTPEDIFGGDLKTTILQPIIRRIYVCNDKILLYVRYYPSFEDALAFYSKPDKKYSYWVLCDLRSGIVTYHANYIINDLDGGPNVLPPIYRIEDIYILSVEDLKNDQEIYNSYFTEGIKAKLKDQEGKFQRLLEPLADDANPIIRTYHWKE